MNTKLQKILCIVGPTASGKTALSIEVAQRVGGEIISADSRQIYKKLTIGTAKPSISELNTVPHHFIDMLLPDEHFSAGDFSEQGRKTISDIVGRSAFPIVAGGTGLYVESLVDGLFSGPPIQPEYRAELESRLKAEGGTRLLEELRRVDPAAASRMLPTNTRRIIRALEVFHTTGIPITIHHERQTRDQLYDAEFMGLEWERNVLYERINQRVDRMIEDGFLDEVKSLRAEGYDERYKALQTVGYKEAFAYLRNEMTFERMVELMKQNTRRFAKRQLTWFRYDERIKWFKISDASEITTIADTVAARLIQ
ncbi:MAG TPA: tRNA (adenosine(37)-N6)-dimethylallyltransferase MiaA [Bacteroidota bacterium]|nr:tRNA (adenosine(37)-N6)-dimethylallyltransferase MiaA [Bacteroidota bacterium]